MRFFVLFIAMVLSCGAHAHSDGEDYVFIKFLETEIEGEFQFNSSDLEKLLGQSAEDEDQSRLALFIENIDKIEKYISDNFQISPLGGSNYKIQFLEPKMLGTEGSFFVLPFKAPTGNSPPRKLDIRHSMFHPSNPTHRGLLLVQFDQHSNTNFGKERTSLVFGPRNSEQILDLDNVPGLISSSGMIYQGMLHIWVGIDHILFLLALILPTVLLGRSRQFAPVESFYDSFKNLLGIITVFTVSHSITLFLASLEIITFNSTLVESIIALSIILAALNNIFSIVNRGTLWIVLALGLFHGMGFASVMANLPFRMQDLLGMVIRFNIGVELGQLVIVAVVFPFLYLMRKKAFYRPIIVKCGSWILVAIATYWMIERITGA